MVPSRVRVAEIPYSARFTKLWAPASAFLGSLASRHKELPLATATAARPGAEIGYTLSTWVGDDEPPTALAGDDLALPRPRVEDVDSRLRAEKGARSSQALIFWNARFGRVVQHTKHRACYGNPLFEPEERAAATRSQVHTSLLVRVEDESNAIVSTAA